MEYLSVQNSSIIHLFYVMCRISPIKSKLKTYFKKQIASHRCARCLRTLKTPLSNRFAVRKLFTTS